MDLDILDQLPLGLVVTDELGCIQYINSICVTMLGEERDKIIKQNLLDYIPESKIYQVMKSGHSSLFSFSRKNKQPFIVIECSIKNQQGEGGLLLLFHSSLVEHLGYYSANINSLKQELDLIMSLIGEYVTITDGKGRFLRASEACEKMMGIKQEELIGKSVDALESEKIVDHSSTKKVIEERRNVTLVQTTKSGRRLLVSGYPIFDEAGVLTKVVNISKDLTETEELRRKLEETKKLVETYQMELNSLSKEHLQPVIKSKSMANINNLISRISNLDTSVLFLGESGVGKGLFAQMLHIRSNRKDMPFVQINLGSIPESIMELELFGNGDNRKQGVLLSANHGTIFLDEIEKLPLHLQVKLLEVLQEKNIGNLNDSKKEELDVRLITATNSNIEELVEKKQFRRDLYYWLNVVPIRIPSLRERKEEIPFLAQYFLEIYNEKYQQRKTWNQQVINLFVNYSWGGNVRELRNLVERLVVTISSEEIVVEHLPDNMTLPTVKVKENQISLKEAVDYFEKQMIVEFLNSCRTSKEASVKLGIDASTLSRKMKRFNL